MKIDTCKMTPDSLRKLAHELEVRAKTKELDDKLECKLARVLHDALCAWNHTDGCPWGYEETDWAPWSQDSHAHWRNKARELLAVGGYSHLLVKDHEPSRP